MELYWKNEKLMGQYLKKQENRSIAVEATNRVLKGREADDATKRAKVR